MKLRSIIAGLILASLGLPAIAQPVPQPTFPPRLLQWQQAHYIRNTVNFNCAQFVSLVSTCRIGALPYNAFVTNIWTQVTTAFNAGTSDTITIGTGPGPGGQSATLMAGVAVSATGGAVAQTVVAANLGIAATGNGINATGATGGFDLWVTQTIVGALPTTGQMTVVVQYIAPNDGTCVNPTGAPATAPAC